MKAENASQAKDLGATCHLGFILRTRDDANRSAVHLKTAKERGNNGKAKARAPSLHLFHIGPMLGGLVGGTPACFQSGPDLNFDARDWSQLMIRQQPCWLAGHIQLTRDNSICVNNHHDIWWLKRIYIRPLPKGQENMSTESHADC